MKFEVIFSKRVSRLVEANSRETAVEQALESVNNGDRVEFEVNDVDYIHEVE